MSSGQIWWRSVRDGGVPWMGSAGLWMGSVGLSMDFAFFVFVFLLTEAGRSTASVKPRLTVTF